MGFLNLYLHGVLKELLGLGGEGSFCSLKMESRLGKKA